MPLQTVTPRISVTRDGVSLYERLPAIEYRQSSKVDATIVFRDANGNPLDLTSLGVGTDDTLTLSATLLEAAQRSIRLPAVTMTATDAANGAVSVELALEAAPGIYWGQAAVLDADNFSLATQDFFVLVSPAARLHDATKGPPTVGEIRLRLRDSSPAESFITNELEFDLAEICQALTEVVQYWNESLPPVEPRSTINFQFRANWMDGAIALLFMSNAETYRRNRNPVGGGQTMIDEMNKEANYLAEGNRRWQNFIRWVASKKVQLNISRGWRWIR